MQQINRLKVVQRVRQAGRWGVRLRNQEAWADARPALLLASCVTLSGSACLPALLSHKVVPGVHEITEVRG